MKKSIALVALAFGVTSAFAQDLTSKKGEPILPEAGDWSVGIDATPFLQYVGNFFGKTAANTAPDWNFLTSGQTITVKKFKDAQTAYRASVRLGFTSNSDKRQIGDATSTSAPVYPALPSMKEDKHHLGTTNIGIAVGMEKRRGKTRLQGYYGADAGFFISTSKDKYTYGNALSASGTPVGVSAATTTNFGSNITTDTYGNAARVTEQKAGLGFNFGVRGFIGAEYFILPKISLGAEFGWGIGIGITGKSTTKTESVGTGSSGAVVGSQTIDGGKSSSFFFDTDRNNAMWGAAGKLKLNFHF